MPDRNIAFLGFDNLLAAPYCKVETPATAEGLEPLGFEAAFLQTVEPSDLARIATLDPQITQWHFDLAGVPSDFVGVALANHNCSVGSDIRFVGLNSPGAPFTYTVVAPNSLDASANATGAVTNVDEAILTPDSSYILPSTTASDWTVLLGFPPLSPTPSTAASRGFFVLRMRRFYTGAGANAPITVPKLTVMLSEGGVLLEQLGYRAVTESGGAGQLFIFPFSFSRLTAPSGTNLQVHIHGFPGSSVSGGQYCALETCKLYYEPVVASIVGDSGWMTALSGGPSRSIHYFPASPWAGVTSVNVLLRSDQANHSAPRTTNNPDPDSGDIPSAAVTPPLTFVQAGIACGGGGLVTARGIARGTGPAEGPRSEGSTGTAATGQPYGSESFWWRETDPMTLLVTREEGLWIQRKLSGWENQDARPFYVAIEPDISQDLQIFNGFWAVLSELGKLERYGRYKGDGTMLCRLPIGFLERL